MKNSKILNNLIRNFFFHKIEFQIYRCMKSLPVLPNWSKEVTKDINGWSFKICYIYLRAIQRTNWSVDEKQEGSKLVKNLNKKLVFCILQHWLLIYQLSFTIIIFMLELLPFPTTVRIIGTVCICILYYCNYM